MRIRLRQSWVLPGVMTLVIAPELCEAAAGARALSTFVQAHVINQALIAFWGVSWAAMFYYGVRMVFKAYKEDVYTETSNAFMHSFVGFAVIAVAGAFMTAFTTTGFSGTTTGVSPGILGASISSISNFIIKASAGTFVLMIVINGLRMLTTQGDEGAFGKARQLIVMNCGGVVLMFIASAIVNGVSTKDVDLVTDELKGIALFLLTLLGALAVIALIVAGILLVVSVEEERRDKAKNIVIGTLITLVVVFILYGLLYTFVGSTPGTIRSAP